MKATERPYLPAGWGDADTYDGPIADAVGDAWGLLRYLANRDRVIRAESRPDIPVGPVTDKERARGIPPGWR